MSDDEFDWGNSNMSGGLKEIQFSQFKKVAEVIHFPDTDDGRFIVKMRDGSEVLVQCHYSTCQGVDTAGQFATTLSDPYIGWTPTNWTDMFTGCT